MSGRISSDSYVLTEEQIKTFHKDGLVTLHDVLTSSEVEEIEKVFDVSRLQPVKEKDTDYHGLDQSGFPQRWYLQVGSYEDQGAAKKLKQALLDKQYKTFLKTVKIQKNIFHRVYIGPKIDRQSAIADKVEIDKLLATDSIVLKYMPQ